MIKYDNGNQQHTRELYPEKPGTVRTQKSLPLQSPHQAAVLQKVVADPHILSKTDIAQLHKVIGNRAACRLVQDIVKINPGALSAASLQRRKTEDMKQMGSLSLQHKVQDPRNCMNPEREPSRLLQAKNENSTGLPDHLKAEKEADMMSQKALSFKLPEGMETASRKRSGGEPAAGGENRVTQFAMYLHNADSNIYKDSDNAVTEYAYVSKGHRAFFIEYENVEKVRNNKALNDWYGNLPPRDFRLKIDNLCSLALKGDLNAQSVITDLGSISMVDQIGKVVVRPITLTEYADTMLISKIVEDTFYHGAQYIEINQGSRLPHGRGQLYYNRGRSLEQILGVLGLQGADLAGVKCMPVQKEWMKALLQESQTSTSNFYQYKIDEKSDVPDLLYVSEVVATRSRNSRISCAGANYDENFTGLANKLGMDMSFNALIQPQSSGWVSGTAISPVDRGDGQAKAMNNWNALGAAAWGNYSLGYGLNLNQNWEWLHIRGAQLGGQTSGGNLVPGLFVTNSLMIPYENLIHVWANEDPLKFWVKFDANKVGSTVFANRISFSIITRGHKMLGDLRLEPFVTFDPISGSVVDKVAGQIIKAGIDRKPYVDYSFI